MKGFKGDMTLIICVLIYILSFIQQNKNVAYNAHSEKYHII
jgi:hypothetical protein